MVIFHSWWLVYQRAEIQRFPTRSLSAPDQYSPHRLSSRVAFRRCHQWFLGQGLAGLGMGHINAPKVCTVTLLDETFVFCFSTWIHFCFCSLWFLGSSWFQHGASSSTKLGGLQTPSDCQGHGENLLIGDDISNALSVFEVWLWAMVWRMLECVELMRADSGKHFQIESQTCQTGGQQAKLNLDGWRWWRVHLLSVIHIVI